MTAPGVSVLVPVRDEAAFVGAALRSVAAQDHAGPVETILADASADSATACAARAALPGVRVVANPGRTAAAGMNRALAAASYGIVARLDARCVLPPDYLRRAAAALDATGAANVGGRLGYMAKTRFERAAALAMGSRLGSGGPRWRVGGPPAPVDSVPLGVFRREALETVGGFDETLERNEDYEVNMRLRGAGGIVFFEPALSVAYRPRGGPRALARQYFDYGRWKRVVVARHPRALRARQAGPPALVLALLCSLACAAAGLTIASGSIVAALGAVVPGAWLAALGTAAAASAWRQKSAVALAMAWPLALMHLAWGAGFLCGARLPRPSAAPRRRSRPRRRRFTPAAEAARPESRPSARMRSAN